MTNDEFKILFTGPMGAGKTTAITALSDQECVSTDVVNTDIDQCDKEMTTAALDYCLLYTSPSPRDGRISRMPSSA